MPEPIETCPLARWLLKHVPNLTGRHVTKRVRKRGTLDETVPAAHTGGRKYRPSTGIHAHRR